MDIEICQSPHRTRVDDSNLLFTLTAHKRVLCGRCVWECRKHGKDAVLGYAHRGFDRVVTTFGDEAACKDRCRECGHCIEACPTGALVIKKEPV